MATIRSATLAMILGCLTPVAVAAEATGCRPPTPDERAWMDAHLIDAESVALNRTALERVDAERLARGLAPLALAPVADGAEVRGRTVQARGGARALAAAPLATPLPEAVDNSTANAFPPVASQGSIGSCACFSTTYYTMTYMVARARGLDAKGGGSTARFSAKFCYNLINGGADNGSWITTAFAVQQRHGVPHLSDWAYDSDFRQWPTAAAVWRGAIPYRMGDSGSVSAVGTQAGLDSVKALLANGYLLNFATDIYGWQFTTAKNDPATSADDALAGQQACAWAASDDSGHAMTVVGYHDQAWIDINGNGSVDAGEKGAFKIVNSWGSGWRNGGFAWLAYDALKATSAVTGWSGGSARVPCWWSSQAYWINARPAHSPTALGEFTLNTRKRNQLNARLGRSATSAATPATLLPSMVSGAGGAYAFDGTTTACDATLVFDLSDLATTAGDRWWLSLADSAAGDACAVKAFRLTDAAGTQLAVCAGTSPAGGLPRNADAGTVLAWADQAVVDSTPPGAVGDLAAGIPTLSSVVLRWTAPGNDGASGTAASYALRYATTPITAGSWAAATPASGLPAPKATGGSESYTLTGLAAGTTYHLALQAVDAAGNRGALSNVVTVATPAPLVIANPAILPTATIGVPYACSLGAGGGTAPLTWSQSGGSVPPGLSFDTAGAQVTGTPSALGSYAFVLRVDDAGAPAQAATRAFTLVVATPAPAITSPLSASATVGVAFSYAITASNSPTAFSASGLPTGLALDTGSGVISGTPGAGGTRAITIGASNASGSGSATVTLTVAPGVPLLTWATPAPVAAGTALSAVQLNASASVPGSCAYDPAAGTVLAAGSRTLTVVFTPADPASYGPASASVTVEVGTGSSVTAPATLPLAAPAAMAAGGGGGGGGGGCGLGSGLALALVAGCGLRWRRRRA